MMKFRLEAGIACLILILAGATAVAGVRTTVVARAVGFGRCAAGVNRGLDTVFIHNDDYGVVTCQSIKGDSVRRKHSIKYTL